MGFFTRYGFARSCCFMGLAIIGTAVALAAKDPAKTTANPATGPAPLDAGAPQNAFQPLKLQIAKREMPASKWATDAEIGTAIDKAAAFLKSQFDGGKLKEYDAKERTKCSGADALAVYALMQAGLASHTDPDLDLKSPYLKQLLDTMKSLPVLEQSGTYTRGIELTALALANRGKEDAPEIKILTEGLLDSCNEGGWPYALQPKRVGSRTTKQYLQPAPEQWGDNSNSQYGALGLWSASDYFEINADVWDVIEKHWTKTQVPATGQWPYRDKGDNVAPSFSMTLAGVASMFVCHDNLDAATFGDKVGREPFSEPLAKALTWLETGHNIMSAGGGKVGYSAYGVERAGLASGFKYFGEHDWYKEIGTNIVHEQGASGSIGNGKSDVVETAYHLLFLARGRHPILMNKLRFDHFWANRPSDLSHLTKFAGRELEKTFNWQVITTQHDWSDWLDCPVLYIASHEAAKFSDEDFAKIRAYVDAGGMLFTQADGSTPAFTEYVHTVLAKKVFPDYELGKVPLTHELYTVQMQAKVKPPLEYITNGSRVLMVHSPTDISMYWQQDAMKSHADAFQTAINLFVYAAGRSDFGNRVASSFIPDAPAATAGNLVKVARVKYPLPTWNPEPYAWKRFANYLGWETSVGVQTFETDMDALGNVPIAQMPIAHLTGTNPYAPNPKELQSLQQYVNNGGTLILEACGGGTFNESAHKILSNFKDAKVTKYGHKSALFSASAPGMVDLGRPKIRAFAMKFYNRNAPQIEVYAIGKGRVIYSEVDLSTSLLGSKTYGIKGYEGEAALQLMRNIVLWSAAGAPDAGAAAPPPVVGGTPPG